METAELAFALKLAEPCLVTSNYLPILSHYCLTGDNLYAYDDVSAIVVGLETGLKCALRGETLNKLLALCGPQVKLKSVNGEDNPTVLLTSGRAKVNLPILDVKEFVYKEPEDDWAFDFDLSADLLTGLAMCVTSVSQDPLLHKEWTAVTMRTGPAGTMLYAFDGVGLIRYAVPATIGGKKERTLMIPQSVVTQVNGLAAALLQKPSDIANIKVGKEYVKLTFRQGKKDSDMPKVHLVGKLLPDKAPDFEHLIEGLKLAAKPFKIPKGFHKAVAKVALVVSSEMEPRCTVSVEGTEMLVHGEGGFGAAETVLELDKSVKKASATVDPIRLARYEERLTSMSVEPGSVAMHGPGVDYYTATVADAVEE